MKQILVCGNIINPTDSIPLRLLPQLKKNLPDINFIPFDPTEELPQTDEITILDTVVGINEIQIFTNLNDFRKSPRISPHDYDLYINLQLLQKLGKIKKVTIIGIPPDIEIKKAAKQITKALNPFNR